MSCYCEKKLVLEDNGDWDCIKNEEIIAKSTEEKDPDLVGIGVDENGFYVFSDSPAGDSGSSFYPKYCPFCGKKLRDEIEVTFMY